MYLSIFKFIISSSRITLILSLDENVLILIDFCVLTTTVNENAANDGGDGGRDDANYWRRR